MKAKVPYLIPGLLILREYTSLRPMQSKWLIVIDFIFF